MGKRPNGSVSIIGLTPDDIPGICSKCRFFDYQEEYTEDSTLYEKEVRKPEWNYEYGEWMFWDGFCRRHPPTTNGKLPHVTGDTIGCGDGISGRERWELGETADSNAESGEGC